MDSRDGRIIAKDEAELLNRLFAEKGLKEPCIEMRVSPTPVQMLRRPPRVGRNEPCPCGSGKKFKRCHFLMPAETYRNEVEVEIKEV